MAATGKRLRRLPVPVRPVTRETIGSFLNRLALANSIRIPHLLALAGIRSSLRSFTPATDDTRGWSQTTPERIADLAGRPLGDLAAAIPLLDTMTPAAAPLRACSHCTAAKNITGLVIIRARSTEYLCTRHQQWLCSNHSVPGCLNWLDSTQVTLSHARSAIAPKVPKRKLRQADSRCLK